MSILCENIENIRARVEKAAKDAGRDAKEIRIMAVTKTVDISRVNEAIDCGLDLIGENKVQEFLSKADHLQGNPEVHMIGHMQTNKVKYIIDKISMIESVDSINLAQEIEKCAAKINVCINVLIEVNIGKEKSKSGVFPEQLLGLIEMIAPLEHVKIQGLMAIPPMEQSGGASMYFREMNKLFIDIRDKKIDNVNMNVLSMGMSGDFEAAIAHGSTLVRIGTALFGGRIYPIKQ